MTVSGQVAASGRGQKVIELRQVAIFFGGTHASSEINSLGIFTSQITFFTVLDLLASSMWSTDTK